jgi:hypothetical protein
MKSLCSREAEIQHAEIVWGKLPEAVSLVLRHWIDGVGLSVICGDVIFLEGRMVCDTHAGLLRVRLGGGVLASELHPQRGFAMHRSVDGRSTPPFTNPEHVKVLSGMAMQIRLMFRLWFTGPKCASPRHAPSIAFCGTNTISAQPWNSDLS